MAVCWRAVLAFATAGTCGCAALAGLDDDYSVASTSTAGSAGAGASTGSATSGGTPTASATGRGGSGGAATGTPTAGGGGTGGVAGFGASDPTGGSGGGDPPTWTVVDTLTVPVDGSPVQSSFSLVAGTWYQLEASGTMTTNPTYGWEGDAEYYDFTNVPTSLADLAGSIDVGIAVDDPIIDGTRTPRWGPYQPSHVYTVDWLAAGGRITANYHDGNHSNNSGTLTLKILALQ